VRARIPASASATQIRSRAPLEPAIPTVNGPTNSIVPAVPSLLLCLRILNARFVLLNGFLGLFGIPGPDWLTSPRWTKPSLILWSLWQVGGGMIIQAPHTGLDVQKVPEADGGSIDGAVRP